MRGQDKKKEDKELMVKGDKVQGRVGGAKGRGGGEVGRRKGKKKIRSAREGAAAAEEEQKEAPTR